jgi:hypothetical protein
MKATYAALFGLIWTLSLSAADPTRVYDDATLRSWGERYQRSSTKIMDEVIWPAFLTAEKNRLGGMKPRLEFPTYAEGEARNHALAFYVPADRRSIVLPIFSLKFLDDLCTAYAWLQIKGYSLETISEYTAILKYGNEPAGGFPAPLKALGIPANALDDPQVNELALGHFVTARTFLLLHETGHVLYRHSAYTSAQSIRNEAEADRFAVTVMKRTPLPPLGILVFFMADAHWSGFPANEQATHPLTGTRVRGLADSVDDLNLARQLRALGEFLDDPEIRAGFVATGKAGDLAALGPRRPGELPRRHADGAARSTEASYNGTYRGELVQFSDPRPIPLEFVLERRGVYVTGRYTFGLGFATITDGKVEGNQLYFNWSYGPNYGQGMLEILDDGSLKGTWGYREARSGAGTWSGRRTR